MKKLGFVLLSLALIFSIRNVSAKTKTIYVLSSKSYVANNAKGRAKLLYTKGGLIRDMKYKEKYHGVPNDYSFKYMYKHGHIYNKKKKYPQYKVNRKGLVVRIKEEDCKEYFSYNKKGLVKTYKTKKLKHHIQYNKKGQLVSIDHLDQISYNRHGYPADEGDGDVISDFYYHYNKHHLPSSLKIVKITGYGKVRCRYKYHYKKIRVKSRNLREVRRQQAALFRKNGYYLPYMSTCLQVADDLLDH